MTSWPTWTYLIYLPDLILIVKTKQQLQTKLDCVNTLSQKLNLVINAKKCYTLHYTCTALCGSRDTKFHNNNLEIPHLQDGDMGMFLGRPIGSFNIPDNNQIQNLKDQAIKILTSKLAPWQGVDAMKTFYYPSLMFLMRTARTFIIN